MQKIFFTFLIMCIAFSTGLSAQTQVINKTVRTAPSKRVAQTPAPNSTNPSTSPSAKAVEAINWLTIEEADKMMREEPKKLFVDLYTDWCGWCKRMDATTFKDPNVVKELNEHYYAVKFDAETKKTVEFGGKSYKFVSGGRNGYNELAQFFLGNKMSYPSFALFDEGGTKLTVIPGYHKGDQFKIFLDFFSGNFHKKMPFADFEKKHKEGTIGEEKLVKAQVKTDGIEWITIEEAQRLMGFAPKKVFIDIYTDWCGWCKRMDSSTFANPEIVKYMNTNFYCVKLDAEQKEDIQFSGKTYKYIAEGKKGYNQLSALLLDGQMSFPSYVVFDETGKRSDVLKGYKKTGEFDTLMKFYGENHFKEKTIEEFKKEYQSPLKETSPTPN